MIKELENSINAELDLCDKSQTPWICQSLSDGYRNSIASQVKKIVLQNKVSIQNAILKVELTWGNYGD